MRFAHIADTHIRNLKYHKEYKEVFRQLYESIRQENVDYIIHCGDIAHTKTQISPEFVDMCSDFLSNLADIAPTYVILGNHDGNLKNTGRLDALTPIVEALEHPDLHLLKNAQEVYLRDGFALNVLSVFDESNWDDPSNYDNVNIALYHGSISNCQTDSGWVMEKGEHDISIFEEFDYAFLGDIHKPQAMDKAGRIRYAGSTVQQGFGESEDKGILVWDIQDRDNFEVKRVTFQNPKPFVTVELIDGKLPSVELEKGARVRLLSNESITLENMKKAVDVAQHRFKPESITFLNRNISQNSLNANTADHIRHDDLRDIVVQRRLIKEFLSDYQLSAAVMDKILELNDKYNLMAEESEEVLRNVNWKIRKLKFDNLFNYGEDNEINFAALNGIIGIFGKNYSGKSSVIDSLLFTLFNTTSKNERKNLNVINFDKEYASGHLELMTEDGTVWNINRQTDKYTKKSRGKLVTEAKTDLNFTSTLIDGTTEERNGLTRNDTDKEIRKVFGTVDDFLLTSMSSQLDSLSFIREGSTKRKEIFAKFLDLELFDKKYKLAKVEASDLRGALKRLEGKNYASDIDEALYELEQCVLDSEEAQKEIKENGTLIDSSQKSLTDLEVKIKATPTELIDIVALRRELKDKKNQLVSVNSNTGELEDKSVRYEEIRQTLVGYIEEFDGTPYEYRIDTCSKIDGLLAEIKTKVNERTRSKRENERQAKILDDIPCGTSYPTCKFIKDAYVAKANIPQDQKELDKYNSDSAILEEKKEALAPGEAQEQLDKHQALVDKHREYVTSLDKIKLTLEKNKAIAVTLVSEISSLEEREKQYTVNKEAIDNLNTLLSDKAKLAKTLRDFEAEKRNLDSRSKIVNRKIGSLEQKIENLREQQTELTRLQEEYSAYDLYSKCMHSNGIAYDIIKSKLPAINEEITKFLMNIVEFDVYFEDEGKKLNIYIQHPEQDPRPLEMGSGAEKTIAAMAIRLALLSVSNLPKGDIFILDEPGTALDEENMEGFTRMLEMIKSHFKTVLLISHLEALKDCVDKQISIEQKDGYAFVNC
jgi:DNA repair exonuclease SbcCD ATPase subunit/DNA repair exonuclease SbcCD nuclease subunit